MEYKEIIHKTPDKFGLINYESTYKNFNWEGIKSNFDHFSDDGVNIAHRQSTGMLITAVRTRLPCSGKMKIIPGSNLPFQILKGSLLN